MPEIINFLNSYKIILVLIFCLYFIFKYLHFRGLRREYAFDTFFNFVVIQVLLLKLYYLANNYQNFPSLTEILLNFNVTEDALFVSLVVSMVLAFYLGRKFVFSVFHILDSLIITTSVSLVLFLVDYGNPLSNLSLIWLSAVILILLLVKKRFISGFFSFVFIFLLTNFQLISPFATNGLIFYVLLNTMNALLIFRRFKYMDNQLTRDFIQSSKEKLLTRREEILKEIKDAEHTEGRDVGDSDYIDEVMEDMVIEQDKLNSNYLKTVLAKIDKALKKIEEGKYGIDEKTGKPIDKARLELFPEAEEDTTN